MHCKTSLPAVLVCSSGNIYGLPEWDTPVPTPCGLSSGASLLWRHADRNVKHLLCQGQAFPKWKRLPVKGWSSTRLQPLPLSRTLYLVAAEWAWRWDRTLVRPSPASFILKTGLKAIWRVEKVKVEAAPSNNPHCSCKCTTHRWRDTL